MTEQYLTTRSGMRVRLSTVERWKREHDEQERSNSQDPGTKLSEKQGDVLGGTSRTFVNKNRAARAKQRAARAKRRRLGVSLLALIAIACGGNGDSGGPETPDPVGQCHEFCERLTECGWLVSGADDPTECVDGFCSEVIAGIESASVSCDEGLVDYFSCSTSSRCSALKYEPCTAENDRVRRFCSLAIGSDALGDGRNQI